MPYPSDFSTAEWIVETPLVVGTDEVGTAALPKLGRLHFTNANVNGSPANLVPSEAIQLVSGDDPIATPSNPTASGTAFDVCTYAASC